VLDGKVKVEGVSAMVLTKGVAACHHSFKGGVCTNCGARQPKKQKKNIISRFLKKGR
jgi:hypothetical protein